MAQNQPPSDLYSAQGILDAETGQLRARRDDERTAAGQGIEHNFFVLCPAIGVSCAANAQCTYLHRCPREPSHLLTLAYSSRLLTLAVVRARSQISLRSGCSPGRNGGNVKKGDFKYSRTTFWVTSRESPKVQWMQELKASSTPVKAFMARDKSYCTSDAHLLDMGDSFDKFLERWEAKTLNKEYNQAPTKCDTVGNAVPHLLVVVTPKN